MVSAFTRATVAAPLSAALLLSLACALPASAAGNAARPSTTAPAPTPAALAASAATARQADTQPALREAARPRRTPAIVLPSLDDMRTAARAEAPPVRLPGTQSLSVVGPSSARFAAGQALEPAPRAAAQAEALAPAATDERPPLAVPAVVLPQAPLSAPQRRLARNPEPVPPQAQAAQSSTLARGLRETTAAAGAAATPAAGVPLAVQERASPEPQAADTALATSSTASSPASVSAGSSALADAPAAPERAARASEPASAPPPARVLPPPDPDSPDAMERLRARLAERLAAVKPPDANSPYELQISTRAVAGASAQRSTGTPGARAAAKRSVKKPLGDGEWGYAGDNGPAAWGGLCAKGQRQSPIDIRGGLPVALEPIGFHYRSGDFSVLDTGHTVQVNVAPGNFAQLGERRFELKQFHFHRPSEETLDGRRFDLSVHLVHRDEQGRRLIVALLVQRGSAQPVLRSVFGNLPLEKHQENPARTPLNPADLLPSEQAYYTYMGSLTTPPCSEDVQWVVLRNPVVASAEQIELFGRLYTDNIRPLQQAEGRRILQTP